MPTVLIPSFFAPVKAITGRIAPSLRSTGHIQSLGRFRLPNDPVGVFTLRFRNLVAGSRVRVEAAGSGATLDEFVASGAATEDRTLSLYASGNSLNDLRIKVRNASGVPAYRPFESQATAQSGIVTVFVFQELDE